jgi:carbamoyl-phosphate synthase large subunit
MINVLITGSGSVLGQSIYKALNVSKFKNEINVFYTNSDNTGVGFYFNNLEHYDVIISKRIIVPIAKDPNYLPAIKKICEENQIDIIFGGTEHEIFRLSELAQNQEYSQKVAALPSKFVDITTDKYETAKFFSRNNLPAPRTLLLSEFLEKPGELQFPLIIKPRISSASRNISKVSDWLELKEKQFDLPENIIVQEYIEEEAGEYTIGCYLDKINGSISDIIMRRQLSKDGASISGLVIKDSKISDYCRQVIEAMTAEGLEWGAVNIQLRIDNGQPKAFEINGRFSSTEGPRAHLGFNAVEAAITNLLKHEPYPGFSPAYNHGFYRFYEEVYLSPDDYHQIG